MKAGEEADCSLVVVVGDVAGCVLWAEEGLDLRTGGECLGHPADIVAEGGGGLGLGVVGGHGGST